MAPALRARPGGALNLWLLPHPAVVPRDEVGRFAAAAQPAPGRQQPPPWRTLFLYWQCRSEKYPAAQTQEEYASAQRPRMGAAAQPQGQRQPGAALQFSQGRSAARRENWLSARGRHTAASRAAYWGNGNPEGLDKKSKTASPALRPQPAQTRREPPRPGEPFSAIGNTAVESTPQPKPRREQPPAPSPCQGAAAQPRGYRYGWWAGFRL